MTAEYRVIYLIFGFAILSAISLSIKAIIKREVVLIPAIVARMYTAVIVIMFQIFNIKNLVDDIHLALISVFGIDLVTNLFYILSIKFKEEIENKKLKLLLSREREKYDLIINNAQIAIFSIDDYGKFNFANTKMSEITGYAINELYSMTIYNISLSEYHSCMEKHIQNKFSGVVDESTYDIEIFKKNGTCAKIRVSSSLVENGEKHIVGTALEV